MNAKHITDLRIENFRGFDLLDLKGLQAVNLIVGQNNVGKTSLLEAIAVVSNYDLVAQAPGALRTNFGNVIKRYFRWLLKDAEDVEEGLIKANVAGGRNQLFLYRRPPAVQPVGSEAIHGKGSLHILAGRNFAKLQTRIVSVQSKDPKELVISFGNAVRRREGEELIHTILRAVDPRILRVRVDPVEEGNIISIDLGLSESIPLTQAGQGIYRLVAMLSDLVGETPHVCIIDEIENGLHHTVFKQVWRGIAEISRKLNIQIFATTHSNECLEAAQAVFRDEDPKGENDFAVIQLMRAKNKIVGEVLTEERVATALENHIELR